MAKIIPSVSLEYTVTLKLNEKEAAALNALTVYGSSSFLEYFYKNLGTSYLQPHEQGLVSLFDKVRSELPGQLTFIKESNKIISEGLRASSKP